MRRYLKVDLEKCTGCRTCELACAEAKKKGYNPKKSLIRVTFVPPYFFLPLSCQFCDKPPCVSSCPEGALEVDEQHRIKVDPQKCIGCTWCMNVCPFGAIVLDEDTNVVMMCDLCDGDPECVKACPTNALELVTSEISSLRNRISAARKLLAGLTLSGEVLGEVKG